eukprot:UN24931
MKILIFSVAIFSIDKNDSNDQYIQMIQAFALTISSNHCF